MPRFGFVGPSYTVQSTEVAAEECINLFAETNESGGAFDMATAYGGREYVNIKSYYGTPGLKVFSTLPGIPRGGIEANGRCFEVAGDGFYEVFSDGTFTKWGTVANDGKAASLAFNSIQILVVSGGQAYCFALAPSTWAANTTYIVGALILDPNSNIQRATSAAWAANTAYALGFQIVDLNGNIQQVTTAGTSGTGVPDWQPSGTTTDGTVVWTYQDYADGDAGTSGDTEPTFGPDPGNSTPDGTGTLVWVNQGTRVLNVTSQLAGVPVQCDGADTYFIVMFQNSNKYQMSQFLDGTTWPGQLVNEVSVFPDNIVSLIVNHRELWIFGSRRSQPFQDTGSAEVFDPIPGALIETGSAATFSVSRLDNSVFWVGQDERGAVIAWRSNGYTPQRISTHAVEVWLSQQANIADLTAYSYQDRGHLFWVLYVPGADCTWVYDVGEGLWHKRAAWVNGNYQPHWSWNHVFCFGKHLVGDWNSNNLYEMTFSAYDDNGTLIRRLRQAPTVKQELERVYHAELKVDFDVGLGPQSPLLDGNNAPRAPQAMLQWSNDGGKTWGNEHWRGCGMAGQTMTFVRWQRLGESRRRVYRLIVTDPVAWAVVDAYLRLGNG